MTKVNPTTVVLNEFAQEIKNRLTPSYGLKNILSAGLALLDMIEPTDREKLTGVIAEGSDAQIQAFLTELFARYTSKEQKRNLVRQNVKAS